MMEVQEDAEDSDWHAQDARTAAQMLLRSKNIRLGNTKAQDISSRENGTRIMHPSNFDEFLVDHPA